MGTSPPKRPMHKNGRSTVQPFVMLHRYIFDSPAYRDLKPGPRSLLWELIRRFNGVNNGSIGLSVRRAADALNLADKDTAAGYFHVLIEHGFIRPAKLGGFNLKDPGASRATEWTLTWEKHNGVPATKEFMRWKPAVIDGPEKPASTSGKSRAAASKSVSRSGQSGRDRAKLALVSSH